MALLLMGSLGLVLLLIFIEPISNIFEKNFSTKEILFLQKEADENNLTALTNLVIFYKKRGNEKLLKKYFPKYKALLFCYDDSYKDMCEDNTIIIEE